MTNIEWADESWNPLIATMVDEKTGAKRVGWYCEKASPGCAKCYAEQINKGFFHLGTTLPYIPESRDKVEILINEKTLTQPLRWKTPKVIFPCSMTDLFGHFHTDAQIGRVFDVMYRAKDHTFMILTKQAERMYEYVSKSAFLANAPLENVQFYVSAENQHFANQRIYWLLKTPAAVRGVSYEPALGPVDFTEIELPEEYALSRTVRAHINCLTTMDDDHCLNYHKRIDRVIVGGESGPKARPFNLEWARSTIRQCRTYGVKVYVKQLGAKPHDNGFDLKNCIERPDWQIKAKKGNNMWEWPKDLQVRE